MRTKINIQLCLSLQLLVFNLYIAIFNVLYDVLAVEERASVVQPYHVFFLKWNKVI